MDPPTTLAASAARARGLVPRVTLRRLVRRSDWAGTGFLVAHLGLLAGTGALMHLAPLPWLLPAALLHGFVLVHLFAPLHEATHGTAFATPALYLQAGQQRAVTREARCFVLVYASVALISWVSGSVVALLYWLLPRVAAEPWMRLVRLAEHGACPRVADMLRNTHTARTLAPLRWLAWNMPFHAEHHALPAVPFHALPKLHPFLAPHLAELEPGYLAAHRRILRAAT